MELPFNAFDQNCPSRAVLDDVVDRWPALVLIILLDNPRRFAETAREVGGISDRMLSRTLTQLTRDGLVQRTALPAQHVEYQLTDIGRPVAAALRNVVDTVHTVMPEVLRNRAAARADSESAQAS